MHFFAAMCPPRKKSVLYSASGFSEKRRPPKEYISLLERTASPFVFRRKHSPNLSLPTMTAVIQTDRYSAVYCRQSGESLGDCYIHIYIYIYCEIYSLRAAANSSLFKKKKPVLPPQSFLLPHF